MVRLTDLRIQSLKPPEKGAKVYYDETLKGFGVRVSQAGTKAFVLSVGKNRDRLTIGRYPSVSLAEARKEAQRLIGQRAAGTLVRRPKTTFGEALQLFLKEKEAKCRPTTMREYRAILGRQFQHLHVKPLEEIHTQDITRVLDGLIARGNHSYANHALTAARTFCAWCERRNLLHSSPVNRLDKPATTKPRERVLNDEELRAVWKAAEQTDGHFGILVRLAILTGQRRGELVALRREWISSPQFSHLAWSASSSEHSSGTPFSSTSTTECSLPSSKDGEGITSNLTAHLMLQHPAPLAVGGENTDCEVRWEFTPGVNSVGGELLPQGTITNSYIEFPSWITKNKKSHRLPIGTLAVTLLLSQKSNQTTEGSLFFPARSGTTSSKPFNGWSKSKAALTRKIEKILGRKCEFVLHDARRTLATNWQRLGISTECIEAYLNHVSGTRSGIVGVYQRHKFWEEMCDAVRRYEEWFNRAITQRV